jgi:hypothetical protein
VGQPDAGVASTQTLGGSHPNDSTRKEWLFGIDIMESQSNEMLAFPLEMLVNEFLSHFDDELQSEMQVLL